MIHVGALPGTPASRSTVSAIVEQAVGEARLYRDGGVHAIGIENMHDVPYLRGHVGPEITAVEDLQRGEGSASDASKRWR